MVRRLPLVLIAVCMTVAALPAAAQRRAMAGDECFSLGGHADARACLEHRAHQSRLAREQAETSFRDTLSRWDEEPQYKSVAARRLRESIANFLGYERSQCELQASLAAGGNGAGDRRLLCVIELNETRAASLREAEASLP